jgi:hypothetical protein
MPARSFKGVVMTETTVVDRSAWRPFFDDLTEGEEGTLITIVVDNDHAVRIEVERKPFVASTYDAKNDLVAVTVDLSTEDAPAFLRHLINRPKEVGVTVSEPGETSVQVLAEDGSANLLHFVHKPALPESD